MPPPSLDLPSIRTATVILNIIIIGKTVHVNPSVEMNRPFASSQLAPRSLCPVRQSMQKGGAIRLFFTQNKAIIPPLTTMTYTSSS